jgi:hypothetical protein
MAGTAPHATRWLLIECNSGWGRDAIRDSAFSPAVVERLNSWERGAGPRRTLLIRQPGRRRQSGSTLILADVTAHGTMIRHEIVDRIDDVLELDLESDALSPLPTPLLLVCTHGKRDVCCSKLGVPLYRALVEQLGADAVWQCSHFGGHRFAPNVLALPLGVMLGRLGVADVSQVVHALETGSLPVEHARGRVLHRPEVQAAELAAYERVGTRAPSGVAYVGSTAGIHRFVTAGGELRVVVEEHDGPALPVSCGGEPERGIRLLATIV